MPFHHRVNEGLVQCTDCHNPHAAPLPPSRYAPQRRRMPFASLAMPTSAAHLYSNMNP